MIIEKNSTLKLLCILSIAFKVMSNASDLIKSYPFVGLLNPD